MLTAIAGEADVVRGLGAGANDYIMKPLRMAELTARLLAQIQAHEAEDVVLMIGSYQFYPGDRSLNDPVGNRRLHLTDKETDLLKFLYHSAGKPVGRRALLREVWGGRPDATSHTVETLINRLRQKIEPDPTSARILVSEEGGYRLCYVRHSTVEMSSRLRPCTQLPGIS